MQSTLKESDEHYEISLDNALVEDPDNQAKGNEAGEDQDQKKPDKKRAKVQRVKLDAVRLCGPRGLHDLPEIFENFKPRGKGFEFDDLDIAMAKLEHWAHRLYPQMTFDDVLARAETLGAKKLVQITLEQIRDMTKRESRANENSESLGLADEEQCVKQEEPSNFRDDTDDTVDHGALAPERSQVEPYDKDPAPTSDTLKKENFPATSELSEEQKRRIEDNRRRAMELRQKKNEQTMNITSDVQELVSNISELEQSQMTRGLDSMTERIQPASPVDFAETEQEVSAPDLDDVLMTDDDVLNYIAS